MIFSQKRTASVGEFDPLSVEGSPVDRHVDRPGIRVDELRPHATETARASAWDQGFGLNHNRGVWAGE
jgi:hypothetical protein